MSSSAKRPASAGYEKDEGNKRQEEEEINIFKRETTEANLLDMLPNDAFSKRSKRHAPPLGNILRYAVYRSQSERQEP